VTYIVSTISSTAAFLKLQADHLNCKTEALYLAYEDTEVLMKLTDKFTQNTRDVNEVSKKQLLFAKEITSIARSVIDMSDYLAQKTSDIQYILTDVDDGFHNVRGYVTERCKKN
jgi:hypothetical protein